MRHRSTAFRSLTAGLLAALFSGCFVGDELDNAKSLSERGTGVTKSPATAATSPPAGGAPKQVASAKSAAPGAPPAKSWWETARSLTSEDSESDIVGCQLGGRVEFMTRDDCLVRGGAAQ